jgi:uncharacterized membrane protein
MNTRLLTEDARLRHLLKTISWRIIGTIDTILLGWWLSGDLKVGASIGGMELLTKMVLYYGHERMWYTYGRIGRTTENAAD